jgi:hypothetical protein
MSRKTSSRRGAVTCLAALAALTVGAPIASARPVDHFARFHSAQTPVVETTVVHQGGFDWGDAAIGAAAAAGVLGMAGAGVLVARRHGDDAQRPAAAL